MLVLGSYHHPTLVHITHGPSIQNIHSNASHKGVRLRYRRIHLLGRRVANNASDHGLVQHSFGGSHSYHICVEITIYYVL
jgi:hypothetical protein